MILNVKIGLVFGIGLLAAACRPGETGLKAAGVIDGQIAVVRALSGGRLTEWTAVSGKEVHKDEILGRIDPAKLDTGLEELGLAERAIGLTEERIRSQIPPLQAKVDYWKRQGERLERLRKDQAVAGGELEKARLELLGAETALDDLRKTLSAQAIERDKISNRRRALEMAQDDLVLRSPVDGVILNVNVTAGEILPPGAQAAEILDASSLRVDVFVEEKELSRLRLGDRAAIHIDGLGGTDRTGTIIQFGSKAEFSPQFTLSEKERGGLLFLVRIGIDPDPKIYKMGTPVTVAFGEPPLHK